MARYTPEEFVTAFLASKNKDEVAEKLGISPWTVIQTAQKLRKQGVKLPMFTRSDAMKASLDVDALNKLIQEKKGA